MFIYFIQETPDGPIKIGKTENVNKRLTSLQTSCSRELKVLHSFHVDDCDVDAVEGYLHNCFRNKRLKGEWFAPCVYLYGLIDDIREDGFEDTRDKREK